VSEGRESERPEARKNLTDSILSESIRAANAVHITSPFSGLSRLSFLDEKNLKRREKTK
jgi:hypothetical protein